MRGSRRGSEWEGVREAHREEERNAGQQEPGVDELPVPPQRQLLLLPLEVGEGGVGVAARSGGDHPPARGGGGALRALRGEPRQRSAASRQQHTHTQPCYEKKIRRMALCAGL